MYIKRNDADGELAAGLSDENMNSESIQKDVKALEPILKMHIGRAYAILGHASEDATRKDGGNFEHVNHARRFTNM